MSKSAVLLVLVALTVNVNGECDYPPYYDHTILREEYQAHSPSEFIEGFKVAYYCQSGYVRTAGSASITCINKMWSALTLKCELVKCPNPPSTVNGEITNAPQGTVTFGTVITYKCNKGDLVGNRELVCTKYGNYSSAPPACKDHKGCRSVQVENGYKTAGFGPVYNYKDFITFACNPGYILHGSDTVTCGINEIWEPELPTCQKVVKCPDPPEIVNGEITNPPQGTVTFGTVIIYKCNEGVLVGNRELVCTKDGNYSSDPPACKDHKGCHSVQVENGHKTAGFGPVYNYGDFITFACNPGYILHGTDTVTCGINEIWEPELPTCQKAPTTTTTTTTTTTEVPPTPSPAPTTTTTTTEVPSTPSPGISSTAGQNTVKTTTTDDKNGPPGRCGKTCGNPLLLLALQLLIKLMPFI